MATWQELQRIADTHPPQPTHSFPPLTHENAMLYPENTLALAVAKTEETRYLFHFSKRQALNSSLRFSVQRGAVYPQMRRKRIQRGIFCCYYPFELVCFIHTILLLVIFTIILYFSDYKVKVQSVEISQQKYYFVAGIHLVTV